MIRTFLAAIGILALLVITDCLTAMTAWLDLPPLDMSSGTKTVFSILAIVATAIVLARVVLAIVAWLGGLILLLFPSVAEGIVLRLWDHAQRLDRLSYSRTAIERRIVAIGRSRLGSRRTSARGVVNQILGVAPQRTVKAASIPAQLQPPAKVVAMTGYRKAS